MLRVRPIVCALAGVIAAAAIALPAQAATYRQIYAFQGGSDGSAPTGLIAIGGTLYGTTIAGGSAGDGTVFALDPTTGSERVLHAFSDSPDGRSPQASLLDVGGLLYGVTVGGGSTACTGGCGTVFSVQPSSGAEQVVYSFTGGPAGNAGGHDGAEPTAALIQVGPTLFGTTAYGGNCQRPGCGTVYAINPATHAESVVAASKADKFGRFPFGGVTQVGARLYGTTLEGGGSLNCSEGVGCGTLFSANPATGAYQPVYAFQNRTDGWLPQSGLLYFKGKLYGTSTAGGSGRCNNGCGTLFTFDVASGVFQVVHTFGIDAYDPFGNVINYAGTLYGTTSLGGGDHGRCGVVFAFHPTNGVLRVIHAFTGGASGCNPQAGLLNVGGTLYGTTIDGGDPKDCNGNGCGTVFAIKP